MQRHRLAPGLARQLVRLQDEALADERLGVLVVRLDSVLAGGGGRPGEGGAGLGEVHDVVGVVEEDRSLTSSLTSPHPAQPPVPPHPARLQEAAPGEGLVDSLWREEPRGWDGLAGGDLVYGGGPDGVGDRVEGATAGLTGGHRHRHAAVGHHHATAGVPRTSLQVKR